MRFCSETTVCVLWPCQTGRSCYCFSKAGQYYRLKREPESFHRTTRVGPSISASLYQIAHSIFGRITLNYWELPLKAGWIGPEADRASTFAIPTIIRLRSLLPVYGKMAHVRPHPRTSPTETTTIRPTATAIDFLLGVHLMLVNSMEIEPPRASAAHRHRAGLLSAGNRVAARPARHAGCARNRGRGGVCRSSAAWT